MLAMSEQQRIGKLQMLLLRFRYFKLFFQFKFNGKQRNWRRKKSKTSSLDLVREEVKITWLTGGKRNGFLKEIVQKFSVYK